MTVVRDITLFWCMFHVLILFMLLYDSRFPRKKTLILTGVCMGALILFNTAVIFLLGADVIVKVFLFTCTLPSLLFFLFMAKCRDGRFFFTFCLADTVTLEIILLTSLLDYVLNGGYVILSIGRFVAFPLLELLVYKKMRRPYLAVQRTVTKGWGVFAGVSALFYLLLTLMSTYPTPINDRPAYIPAMLIVLLLMPLMYWNIFGVLHRQAQLYQVQEDKRIFQAQARMMERRAEEVQRTEERLRIERHDLRHRLLSVAALVEKGDTEAALAYIGTSEAQLAALKPVRRCQNTVLDAILDAYLREAEACGIQTETSFAIPETLPVDAVELSTVFANALENAIRACVALPEGERRLSIKCICTPSLMLEVANTCGKNVALGEDGRPVAAEDGHGVGTRSIAAFVEKYNAWCAYELKDGCFKLQIAL
ncbi:MAG: GHKL domain-containing protein [Clostridia bacterium]|nr:GHKL domain-containing protein [Clostridia bacterium]